MDEAHRRRVVSYQVVVIDLLQIIRYIIGRGEPSRENSCDTKDLHGQKMFEMISDFFNSTSRSKDFKGIVQVERPFKSPNQAEPFQKWVVVIMWVPVLKLIHGDSGFPLR